MGHCGRDLAYHIIRDILCSFKLLILQSIPRSLGYSLIYRGRSYLIVKYPRDSYTASHLKQYNVVLFIFSNKSLGKRTAKRPKRPVTHRSSTGSQKPSTLEAKCTKPMLG